MKVSVHCGSTLSMEHNRRDAARTARDGHIDRSRSAENEAYERYESLSAAFEDIFGEAVREYDAAQTRPERRIGSGAAYLEKVEVDKTRKPLYEVIYQVGSVDDPADPEKAKAILREIAQGWKDGRHQHLRLVGAYLHMDEATPHLHIDYIPVAEHTRGQRLRCGLNRSFEQEMGAQSTGRKATAQQLWQDREREYVRDVCRSHGIETEEVTHGEGRRHLHTAAYKAQQADRAIKTAQKAVEAAQDTVKTHEGTIKRQKVQIAKNDAKIAEQQHQAAMQVQKTAKARADRLAYEKDAAAEVSKRHPSLFGMTLIRQSDLVDMSTMKVDAMKAAEILAEPDAAKKKAMEDTERVIASERQKTEDFMQQQASIRERIKGETERFVQRCEAAKMTAIEKQIDEAGFEDKLKEAESFIKERGMLKAFTKWQTIRHKKIISRESEVKRAEEWGLGW